MRIASWKALQSVNFEISKKRSSALNMDNSQLLHSYNSAATATAPTIGTDRLLRYLPKKQTELRQVAIDIPETGSLTGNQDALKDEGG